MARAAQEALGDARARTPAADLVFVVDDVELANASQPERVVAVMRRAVEAHLADLAESVRTTRFIERTRKALCDKVSFHLIAPMIEAWFFGDPNALGRAGVPGGTQVHFTPGTDPEAFVTADPAYLAATQADCPAWVALPSSRRNKLRPKWLGVHPRDRHPKGYLQWLCRAPSDRSCTSYSETDAGGEALAAIGWTVLLGRPSAHFGFLRALVEDLSDGLGCQPASGPMAGDSSRLTARSCAPRAAVLRNI